MNEAPLDLSVRRWGMGCHLSGLLAIVVCSAVPIPFLGALFPYIVWKLGRDRHPFVDQQGREAINFQLSVTIYLLIGVIFWIVLALTTYMVSITSTVSNQNIFGTVFGWLLVLGAMATVLFAGFMIGTISFAAAKASRGKSYRYPFRMQFLQ